MRARNTALTPALLTVIGLSLALRPAQAQSTLPFTGDFTGGQTSFIQLTPTTEEDTSSSTSANASYGLDLAQSHYFATTTGTGFFLTPGTTSTFTVSGANGSVYGDYTSLVGTFDQNTQTQSYTGSGVILGGTNFFQGATGTVTFTGSANADATVGQTHIDGTIFLPAAVPEASTTASFGLLLALGGALAVVRRKRAA